jgi:glycosyltransferase involved in cell wall biosynthesis
VKDGDSILFVEGMTPLVPTVRYWTELTQKKVNLFGIFHSSTNCPGDLFSNSYPVMDLERYICGALDTVFVATEYLRSLVLGTRVVRSGLPLPPFTKQTRSHDLCKEVLWTHRWAEDKNVDLFIDLMQLMPDFHFRVLAPQERTKIVTAEQEERLKIVGSRLTWVHCVDRTQYLGNLSATNRRGVFFSCATLETFGYSLLEALWEGYYPVVPSWASYEEMVRPAYRYSFDPFQLKDKTYRNKLLKRIEGRIRTAVGRTHPPTIADDFLVPRFVQRYGKPSSVIAEYIMAKESE